MQFAKYRVLQPISGQIQSGGVAFSPGEVRPASDFAGCDLRWLLASKAIEGLGRPGTGPVIADMGSATREQLMEEIQRYQLQLEGRADTIEPVGGIPPQRGFPTHDTSADARTFRQRQQAAPQEIDPDELEIPAVGNRVNRPPMPTPRPQQTQSAILEERMSNELKLEDVVAALQAFKAELLNDIRELVANAVLSDKTPGSGEELERVKADLSSAQAVAADLHKARENVM